MSKEISLRSEDIGKVRIIKEGPSTVAIHPHGILMAEIGRTLDEKNKRIEYLAIIFKQGSSTLILRDFRPESLNAFRLNRRNFVTIMNTPAYLTVSKTIEDDSDFVHFLIDLDVLRPEKRNRIEFKLVEIGDTQEGYRILWRNSSLPLQLIKPR